MQNFTLGKKGISMLFFAFILLIGSSPSFGQTCPTAGNTPSSQTFCYLATVGDIATDGSAVYQTANNTNDTQPIPSSQILDDQATYYVGGQSGSCTRIPVTTTINTVAYPNNRLVPGENSFTISPCSSTFTAEELATYFDPISGYDIRVYEQEFGNVLATGPLTPNASYFVGQVSQTPSSTPDNCPSLRVSVGYNPQPVIAPNATSPQTYCEGATVADLQAQGTYPNTQAIRWYKTVDSFQPLPSNTILFDNTTYYASQVVNDRNSPLPPCETPAADRTPVTVTLTNPIVINTPDPGVVCETDVQSTFPSIDAIRNYYLGLLDAGVPRNGTFNPTAQQIAQMYQNDTDGLGDFTTTYTIGEGSCESSVDLTVSIIAISDANAGTIDNIVVPCGSTDIVVLDNSILSPDATPDGTFTGSGINSDGNFDPAVGPGTYTITYSVGDSSPCTTPGTSDSTNFTITVGSNSVDLGTPRNGIVCENDVQSTFPSVDEIRKYYLNLLEAGVPRNGTFNPTPRQISQMYQNDADGLGDFTTTYTVGSGACQSSVDITVSIVPVQDANAGTIDNITVPCGSTDVVILDNSLLSPDATRDGTFTGTGINSDGNFDPAVGPGTYTITYSVGDSSPCTNPGTSDSITFKITVQGTDLGAPIELDKCITEVQGFLTNPSAAIALYNDALTERGITDLTGSFTPSLNVVGAQILAYLNNPTPSATFVTTYNVTTSCGVSSLPISLTITNTIPADAGSIDNAIACTGQSTLDLYSLLNSGNPDGGTFSNGSGPITNGLLDVSSTGTYNITYTVNESDLESCLAGTDSTNFTVTVTEGNANAGADNSIEVCMADVDDYNTAQVKNLFLGLLEDGVDRNGTFNPTILQIIAQYQKNKIADFKTVYTVGNGACTDSATLTITVNESTTANAGDNVTLDLCSNEDSIALADYLTDNAVINGSFEGFEDGMFNPADNIGTTTITYTVDYTTDENVCTTGTDTATFTITVTEPQAADAGDDISASYCVDQTENVDLRSLLTEANRNRGSFSAPYEDGMFSPSEAGEGVVTITYSLNEAEDCAIGTDEATMTITVNGISDAPVADAEQTFCYVNNPTVADLSATGANIVWYEDADLTVVAESTDPLVTGEDYYAVATADENSCASAAVMVNVTINDSDAPTLQFEGNEFCRQDNPTVQDLVDNVTGGSVKIYTSETGGTTVASSTALVNGTTYYATSTDSEFGCESTERLAITVKVAFCGIPEGFSPNGDNINDKFVIPDIAIDYPNYTIEIFNRWGQVVFEGNASTGDWDGVSNRDTTLGNDVLPVGVYFYILKYNDGVTAPVQGKLYLSR